MTKPSNGEADYSHTPCNTWRHEHYLGKLFGRWEVIEIMPYLSPNGSVQVKVRCTCDKHTETVTTLAALRRGTTTSCGCYAHELSSERNTMDLAGKKFGHLLALRKSEEKYKDGCWMWECECDLCGDVSLYPSTFLTGGYVKRCVTCANKYTVECVKKANTIFHGVDEKRIASILRSMRNRCTKPFDRDYPKYGGRGITLCEEWDKNPLSFVKWSLEHGYAPGLSIDRIDVNGPYSPENCRWASNFTQANNRRCNTYIETSRGKFTASEVALLTGSSYSLVSRRPDIGKQLFERSIEKGFLGNVEDLHEMSNELHRFNKALEPELPYINNWLHS